MRLQYLPSLFSFLPLSLSLTHSSLIFTPPIYLPGIQISSHDSSYIPMLSPSFLPTPQFFFLYSSTPYPSASSPSLPSLSFLLSPHPLSSHTYIHTRKQTHTHFFTPPHTFGILPTSSLVYPPHQHKYSPRILLLFSRRHFSSHALSIIPRPSILLLYIQRSSHVLFFAPLLLFHTPILSLSVSP